MPIGTKVRSKIRPSLRGEIVELYGDGFCLVAIKGLTVKTMIISLKFWEVV